MIAAVDVARPRVVRAYGVAVAASLLAFLLTRLVDDPVIEPNTLLLFTASVTLSSWYGGLGPGLLATALGAVAGGHFLLSSGYGASVNVSSVIVRLMEFVLVSLLICLLNAARLKAQKRAEAARAEAEAANCAKDIFLATVSHELRTPLVSILGWTKMLRNNLLPEAERTRALAIVERNATVQRMLVDDLLDVSRIATGKLHLDHKVVDLADVLTDALNVVHPTAAEKGIEIVGHTDYKSVQVSGDFNRLQQLIWNLLTNAVKFTPPGGRIEVQLSVADGWTQIGIKDTGMGIAPEMLPHVFEPFRQAERARDFRGLGLGLSIASKLAELHGGRLSAESEGEGRGATFTLLLPRTLVSKDEAQRDASAVSFECADEQSTGAASRQPAVSGSRECGAV